MAVTVNQNAGIIIMTAAADEVTIPLKVKSVRFVAESGQQAADVIELQDPDTDEVLWATYGMSAQATEAELIEKMWHNGVKVGTMTSDRGTIYISYK